jgi:hypothetical protein
LYPKKAVESIILAERQASVLAEITMNVEATETEIINSVEEPKKQSILYPVNHAIRTQFDSTVVHYEESLDEVESEGNRDEYSQTPGRRTASSQGMYRPQSVKSIRSEFDDNISFTSEIPNDTEHYDNVTYIHIYIHIQTYIYTYKTINLTSILYVVFRPLAIG